MAGFGSEIEFEDKFEGHKIRIRAEKAVKFNLKAELSDPEFEMICAITGS